MATLFDLEPPAQVGVQLNEAQRSAITHGEGPLLVIAGAGTGKTRVITERIRHLLQSDDSLSGKNILGLTFTNKAAGEMKARVVRATGERGKDVTLATFHAFCESLLKEAAPERLMIDKVDHWILLRRNLERLKLDKYRRLADPGQFLNDFVEFFSRCQDELVSCEDYQRYADGLAAQLESERAVLDEDTFKERAEDVALRQEIARAYRASEELLREKKRVSFGSLITGAVELLETNTDRRRTLQEKYRYILVDEFQDTNIAQLRLLELLAWDKKSIVAVGDNDQAIYRFRGASFGSFKLFLERFAGWREGQDSTPFRVSLVENYRSTPNILRVATQVIAQNTVSADFPKKVLSANKEESEKIRIVELETEHDEARWIVSELLRMRAAGRKWREFAILYRQHAHRHDLVEELCRHKIPFVISRLSILDHPLVKDVLAYLHLIENPADDIACARVLAAPAWSLEPGDLVRLAERARKEKKSSLRNAARPSRATRVRRLARRIEQAHRVRLRAAQNAPPPQCSRNPRGSPGVAGSGATRQPPGPQIRQAPLRIRKRVGAEKRNAKPRRICGVSRLLRTSRRRDQSGRRCPWRCRPAHDRSWRQRPRVSASLPAARQQQEIPSRGTLACVRIPRRADERRRTRRAISHSGRAPPLLRRSDARGKPPDAHYTHREKRQDSCVHRGPADGSRDQTSRYPPDETKIARNSVHRKKTIPVRW